MTTAHVDARLKTLALLSSPRKYYGLYANGKLIANGRMRVYQGAGLVKNALLRSLGIPRKPSWHSKKDPHPHQDLIDYVDKLLADKIIEIKQI